MASELFEQGLKVRKEVLGESYVNNALKSADDFSMVVQEFSTEVAWGKIWTRPGLPRKTRSLINIAMLVALNRPHELKLHIKSSFNNGVTKDEAARFGLPCGGTLQLVVSQPGLTEFRLTLPSADREVAQQAE